MAVYKDDQTTYTGNLTVLGSLSVGGSLAVTGAVTAASITIGGVPIFPTTPITNSLSGDVALNNTGTYFSGPTISQGSVGTWFASGTVTVTDTAGGANINCRLSDGTTVIASANVFIPIANAALSCSLSGFLATPAAALRISCIDVTSVSGKILFNSTGNAKDSTLSAIRIG